MRASELLAKLMDAGGMTPVELGREFGEAWREPMRYLIDLTLVRCTWPRGAWQYQAVEHWWAANGD